MTEPLAPPCVILNEPQLAENIGAVARAMANFGLSDLRMVRPRDGWPQERAWASASGAEWPLEGARIYERLEDAIADRKLVFATTARPRELRLPILTPREAAGELHAAAGAGLPTALLYGGERAGLESDDIALCQAVVTIPIDPKFRSLNLAQSVAVTAYEWRMAVLDRPPEAFAVQAEPADQDALLGLYGQLEGELEASGFFHPPEKTPGMVRNLRAIFARARLSDQEVRTLRGVITALSRGRGRVLEKLARKRAAEANRD
ncbi:MAG: RNA methyltransferase [Caulobacteraceae bacterium]